MTTRQATRRLPILLGLALLAGLVWSGAAAGPVAAVSGSTLESQIVRLVNQDRVARGLRPLRADSRLTGLSGYRAGVLARKGVLSHTAPGNLGAQLRNRRVQWYRYGEVLAYASGWGSTTATRIFNLWKNSSSHWSLLMSNRFNYLGAGLAYRSTGLTFASIVLTESLDHTRPRINVPDRSRSGTTISWSWSGYDIPLQTHTAGLRDYDVLYRIDGRPWVWLRNNTRSRSLTLTGRVRGHSYAIKVRSTDRRGLVSVWSPEVRIYVN